MKSNRWVESASLADVCVSSFKNKMVKVCHSLYCFVEVAPLYVTRIYPIQNDTLMCIVTFLLAKTQRKIKVYKKTLI